jgi:hypothetical protein
LKCPGSDPSRSSSSAAKPFRPTVAARCHAGDSGAIPQQP